MSEKLTRIRLTDNKRGRYVFLDWGEHSFEDMVRQVRSKAQYDLETAQTILNASDSDFEVAVVRGSIVQHFVRDVLPSAISKAES